MKKNTLKIGDRVVITAPTPGLPEREAKSYVGRSGVVIRVTGGGSDVWVRADAHPTLTEVEYDREWMYPVRMLRRLRVTPRVPRELAIVRARRKLASVWRRTANHPPKGVTVYVRSGGPVKSHSRAGAVCVRVNRRAA